MLCTLCDFSYYLGTIPEYLENILNLRRIDLRNNKLTGGCIS